MGAQHRPKNFWSAPHVPGMLDDFFCLINSDIPVTETQTDTEMIDISKTHTETNTEKIFNTDTYRNVRVKN